MSELSTELVAVVAVGDATITLNGMTQELASDTPQGRVDEASDLVRQYAEMTGQQVRMELNPPVDGVEVRMIRPTAVLVPAGTPTGPSAALSPMDQMEAFLDPAGQPAVPKQAPAVMPPAPQAEVLPPPPAAQAPMQPAPVQAVGPVDPFITFDPWAGAGAGPASQIREVVVCANLAGGAGKTPTLAGVMQATGLARGGDVVVVDINPTGNFGALAGVGNSAPLPELVEWLASCPAPTDAQLRDHMAWSAVLHAWVITARAAVVDGQGRPVAPHISMDQATALFDLLGERFSVVGVDAGNNDTDYVYRVALSRATRLLVPTSWSPKTVAGAKLTLSHMFKLGFQQLATSAVVVSTSREHLRGGKKLRAVQEQVTGGPGLSIASIPRDGAIIRQDFASLSGKTTQAYGALATSMGLLP